MDLDKIAAQIAGAPSAEPGPKPRFIVPYEAVLKDTIVVEASSEAEAIEVAKLKVPKRYYEPSVESVEVTIRPIRTRDPVSIK